MENELRDAPTATAVAAAKRAVEVETNRLRAQNNACAVRVMTTQEIVVAHAVEKRKRALELLQQANDLDMLAGHLDHMILPVVVKKAIEFYVGHGI